jgi:uncharacterized lipoprotein YmbA
MLTANSLSNNLQNNNIFTADKNPVNKLIVGIGPINLPEYLQRLPIVYSMETNHLFLSSSDQWSEPLDRAISRVIADNLSRLDSSRYTMRFPWHLGTEPQLAIRISLIQLNRLSVDQAIIDTYWTLVNIKTRQVLHRARFSQRVFISEFSYVNLANAYSNLLAMLSNNISEVLQDY